MTYRCDWRLWTINNVVQIMGFAPTHFWVLLLFAQVHGEGWLQSKYRFVVFNSFGKFMKNPADQRYCLAVWKEGWFTLVMWESTVRRLHAASLCSGEWLWMAKFYTFYYASFQGVLAALVGDEEYFCLSASWVLTCETFTTNDSNSDLWRKPMAIVL